MRLAELQKQLRKEKLAGCILDASDPNFRYYVGKALMIGCLYVPSRGKPTIFVHRLEELKHSFKVKSLEEFEDGFPKKKKVGFNPAFTTVKQHKEWKKLFTLTDSEDVLERLRVCKKKEEIRYIRRAAKIADTILTEVIKNFTFKTEEEVKRFMKARMAEEGVEPSFEPIVASQRAAAIPHYFDHKKIKKGFLIIDMGVKVEGYCSDITRTIYVGKPSQNDKELYENVLKVQKECIWLAREGVHCREVFAHAKEELGEKFVHGLGHGLGLKVHELPNLKKKSKDVFEEGMVFTVEPGWYDVKKKIGIRIEDDVMIRNGKPVVLTKTAKEFTAVPLKT